MMTMKEFDEMVRRNGGDYDYFDVRDAYAEYFRDNAQVGDGATVCYWTDAEAYTIIKRTPKTLTLQRDKATLSPDFKPEFIIGGFCGHCTNQDEQSYTYEEDKNGNVMIAYWSDKKKGFYCGGCLHVIAGRHEFYDYNF